MKYLFLLLFLNISFANDLKKIGIVTGIEGKSFLANNGKIQYLKAGSSIYEGQSVMVEDGSYLQISNNFLHQYYLIGGSHVKFVANTIELINGKIWVNSNNNNVDSLLTTVQGNVSFNRAQFIYDLNMNSGLDQVMALAGELEFSHVLEPEKSVTLRSGEFSVLKFDDDNKYPRKPTLVGRESYLAMRDDFNHIQGLKNSEFDKSFSQPEMRTFAHDFSQTNTAQKGNLYYHQSNKNSARGRSVASKGVVEVERSYSAHDYLKSVQTQNKNKAQTKNVPVLILGRGDFQNKSSGNKMAHSPQFVKPKAQRSVASSHLEQKAKMKPLKPKSELNTPFYDSLKKHETTQKRHPDELNQLIQDLKSYDQQFQENY